MSGNSALAAYTRAAQGRNTDYTGNPAAQLAGWQHSVDTALGNAGETSPQGTLQYLFGNSVTSAMSSAITQKNEHTLLTAQTQGQVMQVLPEISTGLTLTVERILNELQAVINFNRMGFGFKQITIEQLETRLTQWHNGADLTGGTVASYTGRSYTFAVNRYAAAAQIEATALLGPRAPMIFEAILAGLVQSLRLCYAKLALTCMLNNGGKPSYSQSGADGNSGRLLGDVLSFYNRVACFGSRSTNALTMLSTMLTKEAEKRGDQDWPYLLVSQSFVRRAAALLTPGPNLITGKPGGAAVRESSAVAAVSAALGKTLIVIPTIPDGRRFIQLLIRRVHCTEHTLVPASYHVDQRVRQIVLEGKDEATKQAKKRGLELALKRSVVITQVDRVTGIRHSFTVDHLMSNATAGASAAIQAAVNKAGGSVADKNILILDNDIVTLAPHSIVGDAMIACGPKAVDLYATQVLADAAVAVETRLLTIEKLTFIGVTLPEIRRVLVLPPFFADYRVGGGRASIISYDRLNNLAGWDFASSAIDNSCGFVSLVVPKLTATHLAVDSTFGTLNGVLNSSMTGLVTDQYMFGDAKTAEYLSQRFKLDKNYISFKKPAENQTTRFPAYTCTADSVMYLPPLTTDPIAVDAKGDYDPAIAYTAGEMAQIKRVFAIRHILQVTECNSMNGPVIYRGMEKDFLAVGTQPCINEQYFKTSTNPMELLDAAVPPAV